MGRLSIHRLVNHHPMPTEQFGHLCSSVVAALELYLVKKFDATQSSISCTPLSDREYMLGNFSCAEYLRRRRRLFHQHQRSSLNSGG
jgi:hypothetical protein